MSDSFGDILEETNLGAYLLFITALLYISTVAAVALFGLGLSPQAGIIVYEVVGILGAGLIYRQLLGDRAAPSLDLDRLGVMVPRLLVPLLAVVVLALWANSVVGLSVELFPSLEASAEAYQREIDKLLLDTEGFTRVLAIVGVCVAAPVCEEALFRGTILPEQRKSEGVGLAVALNGVLFAAFHLKSLTFVPLLAVGAFLAHLALWTGSLWPPILAHAAFNSFNSLVLPALYEVGSPTEVEPWQIGPWTLNGLQQYTLGTVGLGLVAAGLWWGSARLIGDSEVPPEAQG